MGTFVRTTAFSQSESALPLRHFIIQFIMCHVVFVFLVTPVDQRDRPFVKVHA